MFLKKYFLQTVDHLDLVNETLIRKREVTEYYYPERSHYTDYRRKHKFDSKCKKKKIFLWTKKKTIGSMLFILTKNCLQKKSVFFLLRKFIIFARIDVRC